MMELGFDRGALGDVLGAAIAGRAPAADALPPFKVTAGKVKTYVLEVNGMKGPGDAIERLQKLAHAFDAVVAATADPALALMWTKTGLGLYVDVLDPRFWLIHTTSPASATYQLLRRAIWTSVDLDWCWFPSELLRSTQKRGGAAWFRSDFRGDDLLPTTGIKARHLRVQLEGDDASQLFDLLATNPQYQYAAALTSLATRIVDPELGTVDELAHFQGRFIPRGDSFEMHVGFVSGVAASYRKIVQHIEAEYGIAWHVKEGCGGSLHGRSIMINFKRRIPDLARFLGGIFSCKDPFRLWGVPRVADDFAHVNVADLHIGETMTMDVTPEWMRVTLPARACGNSILRLVTNLQHRYDATLTWDLQSMAAD